jgi:hypothetical protein
MAAQTIHDLIKMMEKEFDSKRKSMPRSFQGKGEGDFVFSGVMIYQLQPPKWVRPDTRDKYEQRIVDGRTLLVVPIRQVPPLKGVSGFHWFGVGNVQKIL